MGEVALAEPTDTRNRRSIPWGLITTVGLVLVLVGLVATYRPDADLLAELGSSIRCPVCQGVPIADSPAPMAQDMMSILRDEVASGATRQEAIDAVLGAYPGSLLLEPELSMSTVALWLVPLAALLTGLGLARTLRRERAGGVGHLERRDLDQRRAQVQADLDGLAVQEANGDVDREAARHLRDAYTAELAETEAALATAAAEPGPLPRSRRRAALGAVALVGSLVAVVLVAGAFIVDRPDAMSGVAGIEDPSEFSNETLAAVIAANLDHPRIDGMRLALAERYFEAGDFPSAFPYYLAIAESPAAAPAEAATALTRLGWMTYAGNGESETALGLLAQARRLAPDDPFPHYLEGIISWCGLGDAEAAAAAFRDVLASTDLEPAIRGQVEDELAAAEAGEACNQ